MLSDLSFNLWRSIGRGGRLSFSVARLLALFSFRVFSKFSRRNSSPAYTLSPPDVGALPEPPVFEPSADPLQPPLLPIFPSTYWVHYLTTEAAVNRALRHIVDGVVGFDTESIPRQATQQERIINDMIDLVGGSRKSAILGWHVLESTLCDPFPYAWPTMGLSVVQISRGRNVWVIHLRQIRALPAELRRILTSPHIIKVGVGLMSDISTVWNDLRLDLVRLVDVGMMARLVLVEQYPSGAYQNLSLEVSVEQVLGYRMDKSEQVSDWSMPLKPSQVRYAAVDAIAALRLYEHLLPRIRIQARTLGRDIPVACMGRQTLSALISQEYKILEKTGRPSRHQTLDPFRPLARKLAARRYHAVGVSCIARRQVRFVGERFPTASDSFSAEITSIQDTAFGERSPTVSDSSCAEITSVQDTASSTPSAPLALRRSDVLVNREPYISTRVRYTQDGTLIVGTVIADYVHLSDGATVIRYAVTEPVAPGVLKRGDSVFIAGRVNHRVQMVKNHGYSRGSHGGNVVECASGVDILVLLAPEYLLHVTFTVEVQPDIRLKGLEPGSTVIDAEEAVLVNGGIDDPGSTA
ncbi:ribonuclease H-like domain-containing protein [Mycena galericulata]|nr:ribonuclease H-like domain-containing protein [Mycena galericulata]KAJ7490425.1 ribonuclease H-like domain-containing protein [Mycena galericulata]